MKTSARIRNHGHWMEWRGLPGKDCLPSEFVRRASNDLLRIRSGHVVTRDVGQHGGRKGGSRRDQLDMLERLALRIEDTPKVYGELDGAPLVERCELCGFHHGIGRACLIPRRFSPGTTCDERALVPFIGMKTAYAVKERKARREQLKWMEIRATRTAHGHKTETHNHGSGK